MRRSNRSLRVSWFFLLFLVAQAIAFGHRASAQTTDKMPLPEYFGVYLLTDSGLREIPAKNPSFDTFYHQFDNQFKQPNPSDPEWISATERLIRRAFDLCQPIGDRPIFVLYHESIKPDRFFLVRLFGIPGDQEQSSDVQLGIAPIQGKQFMYRLGPKEHLKPGVYWLGARREVAFKQPHSCFAVNITSDLIMNAFHALAE